jgi:hypothetical protein
MIKKYAKIHPAPHIFTLSAKSAIASLMFMFCGQTASQFPQAVQAPGRFPSTIAAKAIGAINASTPEFAV